MFDQARLRELQEKGYCCTQIVLQMGLEDAGLEVNPDLIKAAKGLCGGLHRLGLRNFKRAACLLALCIPEECGKAIPELVKWFQEEYELLDCEEILAGNELNKMTKCPKMLKATYEKTMELLEDYGY